MFVPVILVWLTLTSGCTSVCLLSLFESEEAERNADVTVVPSDSRPESSGSRLCSVCVWQQLIVSLSDSNGGFTVHVVEDESPAVKVM